MSLVLVTRDDQTPSVMLLTLNRPEVMNSYNMALHDEMLEAIQQGDADPSVRVMVLTCLLYTSPSPRDLSTSRMPSSA